MTQPMVENLNNAYGGPPKEEAMVGVNHALLNAFHQLYLGKKKQMPPGLERMLPGGNPQGGPTQLPPQAPPVLPPNPQPPVETVNNQIAPPQQSPQMLQLLQGVAGLGGGLGKQNFRQQIAQRLMQLSR